MQEEEYSSPGYKERERRSHHIIERNCQCLWEFNKKLYDDQEHQETEQEHEENKTERSIDVHNRNTSEMKRIPEITIEELQTATNRLKKRQIRRQQRNQSGRHQSVRR